MYNRPSRVILSVSLVLFLAPVFSQPQGGNQRRPLAGLRDRFQNRPQMPQRPGGPMMPPGPDRDGDGHVSEDEIFMAVSEHISGMKQNEPQRYEMLMKMFDHNQNGILDRDEALQMHAEHQKRMQNMPPRPGERPEGPAPVPDDAGLLNGVVIEGFVPPGQ